MRFWPVVLVYLTQLGQLQMEPGWLLEHPAWSWQGSLLGLALLRTLPWALLALQLQRQKCPVTLANAALCLGLWAGGFPAGFGPSEWQLALLQSLTMLLWMTLPAPKREWGPGLALLAALYWPWHTASSWQALLCLFGWVAQPSGSPWRPLMALQLCVRLLGSPSLPYEWIALLLTWGGVSGEAPAPLRTKAGGGLGGGAPPPPTTGGGGLGGGASPPETPHPVDHGAALQPGSLGASHQS